MNEREGASSSSAGRDAVTSSSPVPGTSYSGLMSHNVTDLSLPTSLPIPCGDINSHHDNFGRSVPRDDSGMSIASLGRGRPSDSGYGTDSPASLNTSALRFNFSGIGSSPHDESNLYIQSSPNEYDELDFDLDINVDEDDDVFLDVVPEEEVDGDEDDEPAFPRRPMPARDVIDGATWRQGGGSDGQTDTSTEEEEETSGATSSSSSSRGSSAPISIPPSLGLGEEAHYALTLAYTPPQTEEAGARALMSPGAAVWFASASVRDHRGLWSVTGAHLHCPLVSNARNPLTVRRAAFLTSSPCRNPLQRIQLQELPRRRHSDGVDPSSRLGDGASASGARHVAGGGVVGQRVPAANTSLTTRPRPQSESDVQLERRLGQELRRISDEFHQSYQQPAVARVRRSSHTGHVHHSSSFPERRGSFVERLGELLGFLPNPSEEAEGGEGLDDVDGPFIQRRRAQSEIIMASGISTSCFGRMDSVITDSERSGGSESDTQSDHLSQDDDDDDDGDERATFSLSMEDQ